VKEYIQKVTALEHLSHEEASSAMRCIMEGQATEAQIAAFLIALKMKGETSEELLGFVQTMREKSVKIQIDDPNAIDMCGTGGDGTGTFNISTVASFVVAGAGVTVAKHGNRSISSSCGSADVLKELGVVIDLPAEKVQNCIHTVGIGFLFAPLFHPAMKFAAKPRAELGVKTCFNMLGPLTNPAGIQRQLVGVFNSTAANIIASVYERLHPHHVCVVHSEDGLDEISLDAETELWEIKQGFDISFKKLEASSFGMKPSNGLLHSGGTAVQNATIAHEILNGDHGSHLNIVLVNAAMGIYVAGKATTLKEGIELAKESIDSGKAKDKLQALIEFTNR